MKKTSFLHKTVALVWLLSSCSLTVFSQFQTRIGQSVVSERSPGGLVLPGGEHAIIAENLAPLNPLGTGSIGWDLLKLNQSGNLLSPSKWLGSFTSEHVVWIDTATCLGQSRFVVAGNIEGDMMIASTSSSSAPVWARRTGTSAFIERSVSVKPDGEGKFILLGNQLNPTGQSSVVASRVDCNGTRLWDHVYAVNGYSMEAASVTTTFTNPGTCYNNRYYITGKITPMSGGDDQIFLLGIDASTGALAFIRKYDVFPNADDVGMCIQSFCSTAGQPEIWIAGYTAETTSPSETVLMLKTDIFGLPIWGNQYDISNGDEFATYFVRDINGSLIVTGKATEATGFPGNCMLLSIDGSGNSTDWTRIYTYLQSQGNRVELANGGYFVTGEANAPPDILAILTDDLGQTPFPDFCYSNLTTNVIPSPQIIPSSINPSQITLNQLDFFSNKPLVSADKTEPQLFCQSWDCNFTYTTGDCYFANFTVTCNPPEPGMYTYQWDFGDGTGTIETHDASLIHIFPCGGGTFNVQVTVISPGGTTCVILHTVFVPNQCCGAITDAVAECTPISNQYHFSFTVENPLLPTVNSCSAPNVTSLTPGVSLQNLNFINQGSSWYVSGTAVVPDVAPTSLAFSIHSTCICPGSGALTECDTTISIPTPCCESIVVQDQTICQEDFSYDVPIGLGGWMPLNNITEVRWYVTPKPAGGCPPAPWGVTAYQQSTMPDVLQPLHLYPSSLSAGEYCVYAVVKLHDGPCQELTSNVATLTICTPSSCNLNGYEYAYSGSPIIPGPLTLNLATPAGSCPITLIEWLDPMGNLVQTGGTSFTPTQGILIQNDHLQDCYVDTFYTVRITDACGTHTCKALIRLYNCLAPIGSLVMDPDKPPFLCYNDAATLVFTPECISPLPVWNWYRQSCDGGPVEPLPENETANNIYNTGQLQTSYTYIVEAKNGICPLKQEKLLVGVKPLVDYQFSAISDPCVEEFVKLTLSITPCSICGNPCDCTYSVYWHKDGAPIGTSAHIPTGSSVVFNYMTVPLAGSYYALIEADCCPGEVVRTTPQYFTPSCVPVIMGPCTICNNEPVDLMVTMVQPPDDFCPPTMPPCTFTWYQYFPEAEPPMSILIGSGPVITTTIGGYFIVESNCNDCIKRDTFELIACRSNPCGRLVHIETLDNEGDLQVHIFPNPAMDKITIAWKGDMPEDGWVNLSDANGKIVRSSSLSGVNMMQFELTDLPSGMYFLQLQSAGRIFKTAKVIIE